MQRRRIRVTGVVQGVGFRPFVYGLARRLGLAGFVLNDGEGVLVEAEGEPAALDGLERALREEAPPLARVESVRATPIPERGESGFRIETSTPSGRSALIPADVATCGDCLRELLDPSDRRYRYPFVNCTQCGPRFTIVTAVPYDRPNTTMARFPMCAECRREYEDPADRRFHAEPIACPACGPRLSLDGPGTAAVHGDEALASAVALLLAGAVVAVKGLGGYHLACDATDERAVARLRVRKLREDKPFAVMTADPHALAEVAPEEDALLQARERPIVLCRRRHGAGVAESVAPGNPWLGLMLPYTPLHHLLATDAARPLVLTSGNRSDEPIATDDEEARERLAEIADAFLAHDRPIHRRCEDSVWRRGFPVRRSRGHVPEPLPLPVAARRPVLAAGPELKATFCVARGAEAFLSPHLGDLDGELAYRAFLSDLTLYTEMLGVRPDVVAHDLHPEYLATKWALEQDAELVGVQHHHAHAAACLAEHGETGPALALVFDGTGFGTDGTLWGGELLRCDLTSFERVAHLEPVPLPGGEAAIREPWRAAAIHLERAGRPVRWERWREARAALAVNAPLSSGMGRLFDAAAALLGVRDEVTYEGQAAIELELLAGDARADPYPWRFGSGPELVAHLHDDLAAGRDRRRLAAAFHETVAAAAADACAEAAEPRLVVLSGGTFQNLRLLESTRRRLEERGFRVLAHRRVPANDGGISYGQAAVAAARLAGTCPHKATPPRRRRLRRGPGQLAARRRPEPPHLRVVTAADTLALLDWKRRIFAAYAEARAADDAEAAWRRWRGTRDELFRTHPQSPLPEAARAGFPGLDYYPYDAEARVAAELEDVEAPPQPVATSGAEAMLFRPFARATFHLRGEPLTLQVYWLESYGGGVFVPFRDATSGTETYGGGRYVLDTVKGADLGSADGRLVLDFNFAYNPSCAYDPGWVCPLAPPANRLAVAVEAGERYAR